ncbi:MAG: hypothetical protein L0338_39700 [Acidobacteria bacterium]|nr:hypothetical protein [Acidobacteriota bacterium]
MSAESFEPIPIDTLGGLISILDGADVPLGASPDCRDVQFFPGNVRTRPGLDPIHTLTAGSNVQYVKTFITPDLTARLLMFDSLGHMWKETGPGAKTEVSPNFGADDVFESVTLFGREWIAASDGTKGTSLPTVFDDTNLYVIGNQPPTQNSTPEDLSTQQANPTSAPTATLLSQAGALSAGTYSYKVVFVTGDGTTSVTQAGPASNVVTVVTPGTAGKIGLTNIPTGTPGVVVKRRIYRTLAGGATYFYVGVIADNTTTAFTDNLADSAVDITKVEPPANTTAGQIVAGERQVVVYFESSAGALSKPSPAGAWDATGAKKVRVTNIGIWPGTIGERPVTKRHLAFTASNGATFFHIPVKMTINDNTTTQLDLDFNEAELLAGEDISALFRNAIPTASTDFQGQLGVGAYATRLCWWGGNPMFGQPFRSSLVRWSGAEDPEFYDNLKGLMNVSENDGQGIKAGFELNERFYFVKDNSIHSTEDDGINEPNAWQVNRESPELGTPSVHGVGVGENWVVIAHRSGLYYFDGGQPQKISQEIQPTWDSINWTVGHLLWVQVDTDKKRIYIGAPFCTATTPNLILMMDYQEGLLVDPIANAGRGRKWCPWFIKAGHGNFIRRANMDDRFVIGMANASALVHENLNSKLSDNGVAINNYYRTAFVSREEMGRQLFGYFSCLARGSGNLDMTTIRQGGTATVWNSMVLASPAPRDLEKMIDVQSERVSFKLGTNAIDKWFSVAKLCAWAKEHPTAKHRGTNV